MNHILPWKKRREETALSPADAPAALLHSRMNDLMDEFFREFETPWGGLMPSPGRGGARFPSLDVSETDTEIQVHAELPGMSEKDIEVTLDDGSLTLHGEKKQEREDKSRTYHVVERSWGEFHRVIPIPSGVDTGKVKATFKDGILRVTLPKTEDARSRKKVVTVQAG